MPPSHITVTRMISPLAPQALPLVQLPVQSFVDTLFWAQSSLEGYTDHVWTFRELLTVKFKPLDSQSICRRTRDGDEE